MFELKIVSHGMWNGTFFFWISSILGENFDFWSKFRVFLIFNLKIDFCISISDQILIVEKMGFLAKHFDFSPKRCFF